MVADSTLESARPRQHARARVVDVAGGTLPRADLARVAEYLSCPLRVSEESRDEVGVLIRDVARAADIPDDIEEQRAGRASAAVV